MGDNPLINIGDFGKLGDTLIKKISGAIGVLYEPTNIRRTAKANAKAAVIEANSQIEVTDLQRRAVNRFLQEEAQNQTNIENVVTKALPMLDDEAEPDAVESDWIRNFFDKTKLVSDSEMQSLYARILAGEANKQGSFSKKTLNFLASFDKKDAEKFSLIKNFCASPQMNIPLIYKDKNDFYRNNGLAFSDLKELDSLGLINFDSVGGFGGFSLFLQNTNVELHYCDTIFVLSIDSKEFNLGHVLPTEIGRELLMVSNSKPIQGFVEFLEERFTELGYDPKRV